MLEQSMWRLRRVAMIVTVFIMVSGVAYAFLEDWTILDGLYMAAITFTTVGYGEPHDLSPLGKLFTLPLLALSFTSMILLTAYMTSFVIENDLSGHLLRRRTRKMISQLEGHTIVCGTGKMAHAIIERLFNQRKDVVVISDNQEEIDALRERYPEILVVDGKPTDEMALAEANIITAKHVVAATQSEVDNLLISITCKDLGSDVHVYARSNDSTIGNRMRKAAVDEVISPCQLCGDRVASLILASDASTGETRVSSQVEEFQAALADW